MITREELAQIGKAMSGFVAEKMAAGFTEIRTFVESRIASIPAGAKGEPGEKGIDGTNGRDGINGKDGTPGKDGSSGIAGSDGKPGRDGVDGKDAPPVDTESIIAEVLKRIPAPKETPLELVRLLVESEVSKVAAALPKPKDGLAGQPGEKGDKGADGVGIVGPAGPQGERGADGESIHPDTVRLMVQEAVEKAVALIPKAIDGQNGKDGAPGKDADVIVRGICDAFELTQSPDDPRVLIARSTLPDGTVKHAAFRFPVALYQGVFKASEVYEQGDLATHDGSVWHCNAAKTSAVPGKSEDWQLAVKSVRGKDGRDGKDGTQGPEGPPGKDLRYQ